MLQITTGMLLIETLIWEQKNTEHIARHSVTPEEVEQVCFGLHVVRQTYYQDLNRLFIIGPTITGRIITIIVEHRIMDTFYPITARDATEKEKRRFSKITNVGEGLYDKN